MKKRDYLLIIKSEKKYYHAKKNYAWVDIACYKISLYFYFVTKDAVFKLNLTYKKFRFNENYF